MIKVNVAEAKARLSELLAAVERGEEVVISRRGVPLARLSAVPSSKPRPRYGALRGRVELGADFDAPLDDFSDYR